LFSIEDCGLMLEPQLGMKVNEVMEWARYAERSGYGYVYRSDHLLPTSGRRKVDSPECWTTLGMIAVATKRVKFGPMVSPIGFRNPALLAKMACTLYSFAEDRFRLGLGAGWYRNEYLAHGYEFPRFHIRIEQLREALAIIKPLAQGKKAEFQGKYFSANTDCLPRPKDKLYIIIGGKNYEVLELVSEYADEWNIYGVPLEEYGKSKKILDSKANDRRIKSSLMTSFIISDNKQELGIRVKRFMKLRGMEDNSKDVIKKLIRRGIFCGTIDEFVSQVNDYLNAGIEKFYFQVLDTKDKEMINLLTDILKNKF
jgi:alkanesulfonate monooxygenase SsuD/methylene tetrahydromethanopterin reductase-like flavin-dependent oxidoreductase (luciferase family)